MNSIENLKLINDIKVKVERLIIDDRYKQQVKEFVKAYDEISSLQNQYFSQFAAKFTPPKAVQVLKQSAIESTVSNLMEAGIQIGTTEGLRKILLTNMQQGGSISDLTDQLKTHLVSTKENDSSLLRYTKGFAVTAINQYSAEYNKQIADDLGLEWYMYTGSLLETSREFCKKAVEKKWIHASEFHTILKGDFGVEGKIALSKTTGLPPGLMEGTNADNFPRRRGGWNCGHQLIAVDDSIVPQSVQDEVYATPAYKAWARKNNKKLS